MRRMKNIFLFSVFLSLASVGSVAYAEDSAWELKRRTFINEFSRDMKASKKVPVAFFDADSTLRVARSGSPTPNTPTDYVLLPMVHEVIRDLVERGYLIVLVSNQGGIPQYTTLESADQALYNLSRDLWNSGARVHYYDFAETDDQDRKPGVGMALRLEEKLRALGKEIDKEKSFMVGDSAYKKSIRGKPADTRPDGRPGFNFSNSDRFFAENYGIDFYEPQHFFGWIEYSVELIETMEQYKVLYDAVQRDLEACEQLLR
jgi:DNA 3'-phosphatase